MSKETGKLPLGITRFRARVYVAMLLTIAGISALGLVAAQRYLTIQAESEFRQWIEGQIATAAHTRNIRQTVIQEICDGLAREPRIHAALEDDALDLLYPSAANEMRKIRNLNASFYRFLDTEGEIIDPGTEPTVLLPTDLSIQQPDYILQTDKSGTTNVVEIYTAPIISNETLQPIALLVVGFPFELAKHLPDHENLNAGVWVDNHLIVPHLSPDAHRLLKSSIEQHFINPDLGDQNWSQKLTLDGIKFRVMLKPLKPVESGRMAYEVFTASLHHLSLQQKKLRYHILTAAGILLLLGMLTSHVFARRLAVPVEALARTSEFEHNQRIQAETALDSTTRKLERAARYSADASHQLKTPLTVMRAGLEELKAHPIFPQSLHKEIRSLLRQTDRLTSVIEDLLLLSRMDAGHLSIKLSPLSLKDVIDEIIDDFSILPNIKSLRIDSNVSPDLKIMGDHGYTSLILQCLMENARKYNRPQGSIYITAKTERDLVKCRIGNTGQTILPIYQAHIFERFHRGPAAEDIPGYGLGLNLANQLTKLHGGRLILVQSHEDWTEFEISLPAPR